jgi:hypothetical protein
MKVSQMIKNLQEFMKKHGDLDCWYATDDEGNEYHEVYFTPSYRYATVDGEMVSYEDIIEFEYEEGSYKPVCVVN